MATLFAWSGALRKRGELDGISDLSRFADVMEQSSLDTIEAGEITGDLKSMCDLDQPTVLTTEEFLKAVAMRISRAL
jgi:isocitrate dehydrogenase